MMVGTEHFLHRHFLATEQIKFMLGGPDEQLLRSRPHLVEPVESGDRPGRARVTAALVGQSSFS
jgi:hypothetical protein